MTCPTCGNADVVAWRRRRTARWAQLSLAARAVVLEVVMAMDDRRRELELGPLGLRALEPLVGRPWAEVEPAVLEALQVGKLVLDASRNVLIDESREGAPATGAGRERPCHAPLDSGPGAGPGTYATSLAPRGAPEIEKGEAFTADMFVRGLQLAAERAALVAVAAKIPKPRKAKRELSQTPTAIRLRELRAAKRGDRQPDPTPPTGTDGSFTPSTNVQRTNTPIERSSAAAFLPVNMAPEQRSFAFAERTPLSDHLLNQTEQQKKAPRSFVLLVHQELDADGRPAPVPMPPGWLDWALGKREDMQARHVEWVWTKFARAKSGDKGKLADWGEVQHRFHEWLMTERIGDRDVKPSKPIRKARPTPVLQAEEELEDEAAMRAVAKLREVLNAPPAKERAA